MNKVLVIGIDGATWDLITPWVNEGKLPTFRRLMEKGTWGTLESTIPYLSPVAWTSAFTGVNPGKHGIFDFISIKGYTKNLVTSKDRKREAVWEILSQFGKKVIVLNVPITYPPDKVNGIMISGIGTPSLESDFIYPKNLKSQIFKELHDYQIYIDNIPGVYAKNAEIFYRRVQKVLKKTQEMTFYLLNTFSYKWDFFATVFMGIDWIQHFFWKYMDSKHPSYTQDSAREFGDAILKMYYLLDRTISKTLDILGPYVDVIIISDHGFGPVYKDFYINNYLIDLGLLKLKWMSDHFMMSKSKDLIGTIYSKFKRLLPQSAKGIAFSMDENITNWSGTKVWAFSPDGQSLKINLKDREPQGIVRIMEYEKLRDFVIKRLYEFRDPKTNEEIIDKVHRREEIYWGPYLNDAPDLIIQMKNGYVLKSTFGRGLILPARQGIAERSANHRIDGIFLAYGPRIKKGQKIERVKIYDVVPTILHMFGLPILSDLDGRVLTEMFDKGNEFATKEVRYVDSEYYKRWEAKTRIRERLRSLGKSGKI